MSFLRQFCNAKGIIVDQCIEDYGSGLNYNRKERDEEIAKELQDGNQSDTGTKSQDK